MRKIFILIMLFIFTNMYSITYIEETTPKQLYTTTETHFGNQERINIQNDYPLSYSSSFGISPQAIGDNESGSVTVNGVTVTWEVSAPAFGLVLWTITYSDGTTETRWGSFGEVKRYAEEQARKKAEEQSRAVPIGDINIFMLLLFFGIYTLYKLYKIKTEEINN